MLSQRVFLFQVSTVHDTDQYDLDLYFQDLSKAAFLNLGDYVKDTAGHEYEIISGAIPHVDGARVTVKAVTQNTAPVEDSGYDSEAYTPGQVDRRPALRSSGSIGSVSIFNAPNYEYTLLTGWDSPGDEAKAAVGDRVVDLLGKEFELTFIDPDQRFASPCRVKEVERVGIAPGLGPATLYRATANKGFFQGTEISDPARTTILNRDKHLIDELLTSGSGGGEGGGGSGDFITEYHTITEEEAAAKEFTLNNIPDDPTEVVVDVIHGSSQEQGVDYDISGSTFTWSGLSLDGVLEEGDRLRFLYFK